MSVAAQAACLSSPRGSIVIDCIEVGEPGPGEVRVRMEACGICHSDVMIAALEKLPLTPLVLGHEGIGIVEAAGEGVAGFAPGDRIGITYFGAGCGKCEACRGGSARYCARQTNHGYTRHGALSTTAIVAAQNLVKVPAALPAASAAPLCCAGWTAMGAIHEAELQPGQTVAVFGFGGLGHLGLQYARHAGAQVAVVDVSEDKLDMARSMGATAAITPDQARPVLLKERGGVDAAILFTASAAAVATAFSCLKRRGRLILVGLTTDTFSFAITEAVLKGVRIQGSFLGSRDDLEQVFALAVSGVAVPSVSTYPLAEAPELIARLGRGEIRGRAVVAF